MENLSPAQDSPQQIIVQPDLRVEDIDRLSLPLTSIRLTYIGKQRPSSSPPKQLSTPSQSQSGSLSTNLLNVPGQGPDSNSGSYHQRSSSFGSSGTSAWTQSPSTVGPSSEIGEKSETKLLLKQDESDIPNNPFAFSPKQLAKLHDPKDLNMLRSMGGVDGLTFGLWTDVDEGLPPDEDYIAGRRTLQDVWNELERRKREEVDEYIENGEVDEEHSRKDRDPGVDGGASEETVKRTETASSAKRKASLVSRKTTLSSVKPHGPPKGFSDRKRIFAENRIPTRKPKGIFQLMWMALHDKILVYCSIANC